jgi:hypothetical protein
VVSPDLGELAASNFTCSCRYTLFLRYSTCRYLAGCLTSGHSRSLAPPPSPGPYISLATAGANRSVHKLRLPGNISRSVHFARITEALLFPSFFFTLLHTTPVGVNLITIALLLPPCVLWTRVGVVRVYKPTSPLYVRKVRIQLAELERLGVKG